MNFFHPALVLFLVLDVSRILSHPVSSCLLPVCCLLLDTNATKATGIIEYGSAEDATRVVSHVHGKLILGRPVTAWVAVPGG